ncbi:DNA-binding protein [Opitutaceae bacterium TAV5]|nr:DNA-binding protein [Opitutaceae bacterium TAV5]
MKNRITPGRKRFSPKRNPLLSHLGTWVREKREALGLTQEKLAERANLSKNYIGNIKRGEQEAGIVALIKIASGLGTTASVLIAEIGY